MNVQQEMNVLESANKPKDEILSLLLIFHPSFIHSYPLHEQNALSFYCCCCCCCCCCSRPLLPRFSRSSALLLPLIFLYSVFLLAGVATEEEEEAENKKAAKKSVFRYIIVTCKFFLVFLSLLFSSVWSNGSSFSSVTSLLSSSSLSSSRLSLSFDFSPRFCSFPQIQLEREL